MRNRMFGIVTSLAAILALQIYVKSNLIPAELFDDLASLGHQVSPGDLGENITIRGIQLERCPLGALLRLGPSAAVELTGGPLRVPARER